MPNTVDRDLGVTLSPRKDVTMLHVVLCVGQSGRPEAVSITADPLNHSFRAQVVMYKTRSLAVARQVALYVRRTFEIEEPVIVLTTGRPVEAMIGYACTRTAQHPPGSYDDSVYLAVLRVSELTVQGMLDEVAGGHSASRTRYVVYEVRGGGRPMLRGITNKFSALEDRYRRCPPDTWPEAQIYQVGRTATSDEAEKQLAGFERSGDALWTRKPPVEYLRKVLRLEGGDLVWAVDGRSAVRRYGFSAVVIGPHVYTEEQVLWALEHGEWLDGRTSKGRRARFEAGR